jgi:hypothetical protein
VVVVLPNAVAESPKVTPLTKQRFELIIKRIKEKDEYATI